MTGADEKDQFPLAPLAGGNLKKGKKGDKMNEITLKELDNFWSKLSSLKKIGEWKKEVKEFATKHNLTDIEAINIAKKRI